MIFKQLQQSAKPVGGNGGKSGEGKIEGVVREVGLGKGRVGRGEG